MLLGHIIQIMNRLSWSKDNANSDNQAWTHASNDNYFKTTVSEYNLTMSPIPLLELLENIIKQMKYDNSVKYSDTSQSFFSLLKSLFSFVFKEEAIHYKTGKIG